MATNSTEYTIPQEGYVAFDATGLRSLIVQRLNQNKVFTDQNYIGSNISSVIDVIAYSYHVLMFYMNQTGSESLYSQSTLYENINKIVKMLNYNPIGYQTATLSFFAQASDGLQPGTYTIPRYSYFVLDGHTYCFNQDITFTKSTSGTELVNEIYDRNLLYQGVYSEYPIYTATGEPFEQLTISLADALGNVIPIDHFNIDVYVKDSTVLNSTYQLYKPTESLFLEDGSALKYEIRLNERGRYEIKFGNNIHGKQLNVNDQVMVYYLKTDKALGEVSEGTLNSSPLLFYNSIQFNQIKNTIIPTGLNLLTTAQASNLYFYNTNPSTKFQDIESVDSIRTNALNTFKTQFRLVTAQDFKTFILKNFGNILASVQCISNTDYINGHLKYYFDLGVEKPSTESRVLLNQVNFSSSCNFNNLYVYCTPKLAQTTTLNARLNYLSSAQKQLISNEIAPYKIVTSDVVYCDPVYMVLDFGVAFIGETLDPSIVDETFLDVFVDSNQSRNYTTIQQNIASIIQQYFDVQQDNLGKLIDMGNLSSQILQITGVKSFQTTRTNASGTQSLPGISFLIYNPVYPNTDINTFQQNLQLPYYKFPVLNNPATLVNKIRIIPN
jgi:hypothetical protein